MPAHRTLRTALRAAIYLNIILIFVAPAPYVPLVIVGQVVIVIADFMLRRQRRPRQDGAIHPR